LLGADSGAIGRYEADGSILAVAGWSEHGGHLPVGTRSPPVGGTVSAEVMRSGRSARIDSYEGLTGPMAEVVRVAGIRSSVGAPIIVDGRVWGVMIASSNRPDALPLETEERLAAFTELVETAISNAEGRAQLTSSRTRIVAAGDETRRRIERDLHDGAQQRLVSLALELRAAEAAVPAELGGVRAEVALVGDGLLGVLDELREMARGIHPAILAEGGLGPALKTLARRSPIPVTLDVQAIARLPERVEVAAYYVVSETLTNAAKHAQASFVEVGVEALSGRLRISIHDDGIGGANPAGGSGLVGLTDRVEAIGGRISVRSPVGAGTSVTVEIPLDQ
ncbi:MAG: GAF domain-containing protein, partial [Actinomycetota bacterium]|nr:GAF domain-containing protein [Actinomycetota bacterium]